MNWGDMKDGAANIKAFYGAKGTAAAGSTGDATEVSGAWVDRRGASWCKMLIFWEAVLTSESGATLSFVANLQDATSAAGAGAADFGDPMTTAPVGASDSGGSTEKGVTALHFDLTDAERYIRPQVTPDLSAAGGDSAVFSTHLILGGYQTLPADTPVN